MEVAQFGGSPEMLLPLMHSGRLVYKYEPRYRAIYISRHLADSDGGAWRSFSL